MSKKNQVAVVIPFYKPHLSELEEISLLQCLKTLSGYPIVAVIPNALRTDQISNFESISHVEVFSNRYFENVQSYNELMLSDLFYERFLEYEFILIYQLDAFVFKDDLKKWCDSGYDYVGAPWLKRKEDHGFAQELTSRLKSRFYIYFNLHKYGLPSDRQFDNTVGNGGFSLRRVQKFHELAGRFKAKMKPYLTRTEFQYHEDVFWSIEINRKQKFLNIPAYKTALDFSFENKPERALRIAHNKLPFGCHAWDLHKDFWRKAFADQGYKI
jgi:hypothetical protein